ncbi:MAG TPA: aspartate aminotransferase family protein [Gammaproteobacteria bacterium]|nr:aspartate aminotransferase family protein [Gammaproteobacteria bacterium]
MSTRIMPTYYNQMPVSFERGRGVWLWDSENNPYLDALAGIAVCGLGHAHPAITETITEQAGKLLHTSNTYTIAKQIELAEKLTRVAGMDQAYFCNSGAETNETAIKLARLYAKRKNIAVPLIITMKNAFHGRTMATLSASGSERLHAGFEPLVKDFVYVTLNDISELDAVVAKQKDHIVAILLEPIQGDGGIQIATEAYLKHIRALCDEHDWLMMLDEVQTGMGRTGQWFAFQHTPVQPDVLTVAKALGNGIPIGACLARGKACNLFGPGKHGSTFGGNPFACAVGATVIDTMEKNNLLNHAAGMGAYLVTQLKKALAKQPGVVDIRGRGLMIGVELDRPCMELPAIGLKHRLLFNITSNKVIRLLPPLILTSEEADEVVKRLDVSIGEFYLQDRKI